MKILVFGAGGMIGSAIFRVLHSNNSWNILGTVRKEQDKKLFAAKQSTNLVVVSDVLNNDLLIKTFVEYKPDVVINCIGLTKHHQTSEVPLLAIPLNSLLPHRMAQLCSLISARFIHISTDCVFSGSQGSYSEKSEADAQDLYGKSKLLGEVVHDSHALTLRTSTIGHELNTSYGLLEWFLGQKGSCSGFNKAIFSGLPNIVLAEVIRDYVIPNANLHGLYHVGAKPIGKYELLQLIAKEYQKSIDIAQDNDFKIDRSLNSEKFYKATGYYPLDWPVLIRSMHLDTYKGE